MSYPTRERAAQVRLCVITFVTSLSHNIINGMMRWNRTYDESETHNDARGRSVWFELNRSPKTSGLSETSGLTWHGLRRGKRMQQQLAKRRRLSILFVIWKQSVGGLVAHGELCDMTGRNNDGQTIYRFMNTRVENNSWKQFLNQFVVHLLSINWDCTRTNSPIHCSDKSCTIPQHMHNTPNTAGAVYERGSVWNQINWSDGILLKCHFTGIVRPD